MSLIDQVQLQMASQKVCLLKLDEEEEVLVLVVEPLFAADVAESKNC